MQKSSYIQSVLFHIEKALSDELPRDICPESIAAAHFVSLRQLYRDFCAYTGHAIKAYIRKRRISKACEKIKNTQLPLAIIANQCGYETQQAFHKQFKHTVGMTPLAYQKSNSYFYFPSFTINKISLEIKVSSENIPDCDIFQYYHHCLKGIEDRAIGSIQDNDLINKINNNSRVFGRNGGQQGNQFCYEIMTEKINAEKIGTNGLYATCTVHYNEQAINSAWNYIYNTWLFASMFEASGAPYFEEYIFQNNKIRKLKLYLPVKKKRVEPHITIKTMPESKFIISRAKGPGAEKASAQSVMDFLRSHYPNKIPHISTYYVCEDGHDYACGVAWDEKIKLPANSKLEILCLPQGRYAILPDDRLGDIHAGSARIQAWLKSNALQNALQHPLQDPLQDPLQWKAGPVFAIYQVKNKQYDDQHIEMALYIKLKDDTKG